MFLDEHMCSLFRRPRSSETLGTIRDPKGNQRHDRRVAIENVGLNLVERVDRGMVRVLVLGRILPEANPGQTCENERTRIGVKNSLIIDRQSAERIQRLGESLNGCNQVISPTQREAGYRSLPVVQNDGS